MTPRERAFRCLLVAAACAFAAAIYRGWPGPCHLWKVMGAARKDAATRLRLAVGQAPSRVLRVGCAVEVGFVHDSLNGRRGRIVAPAHEGMWTVELDARLYNIEPEYLAPLPRLAVERLAAPAVVPRYDGAPFSLIFHPYFVLPFLLYALHVYTLTYLAVDVWPARAAKAASHSKYIELLRARRRWPSARDSAACR